MVTDLGFIWKDPLVITPTQASDTMFMGILLIKRDNTYNLVYRSCCSADKDFVELDNTDTVIRWMTSRTFVQTLLRLELNISKKLDINWKEPSIQRFTLETKDNVDIVISKTKIGIDLDIYNYAQGRWFYYPPDYIPIKWCPLSQFTQMILKDLKIDCT